MDFYQTAIDIEQLVEDDYRALADHCSTNIGIKNILTMLADDHEKHRSAFIHMKKEEDIALIPDIGVFKKAKEIFSEIKKKQEPYTCDIDQVKLYEKARELVRNKISLYTDAMNGLKNEPQKKILQSIITEEMKQEKVLDNIIEMVNRPNTWLEDAEFYHLDEY